MIIKVTLTTIGANHTTFRLRSDSDNYASILESGVTKAQLFSGHSIEIPNDATILRIESESLDCSASLDVTIETANIIGDYSVVGFGQYAGGSNSSLHSTDGNVFDWGINRSPGIENYDQMIIDISGTKVLTKTGRLSGDGGLSWETTPGGVASGYVRVFGGSEDFSKLVRVVQTSGTSSKIEYSSNLGDSFSTIKTFGGSRNISIGIVSKNGETMYTEDSYTEGSLTVYEGIGSSLVSRAVRLNFDYRRIMKLATSYTGNVSVAVDRVGRVYISHNYFNTWFTPGGITGSFLVTSGFRAACCSSDGQIIYIINNGGLHRSNDRGVTFTVISAIANVGHNMECSNDGVYVTIIDSNYDFLMSTNSGGNFTGYPQSPNPNQSIATLRIHG